MLYRHQPDPPQVRLHCRNPRCGGNLKIPTDNPRDAFCCRGCERRFYGCRCRVCESLFSPENLAPSGLRARPSAATSFKRHSERFFGSRSITPQNASIAHNAHANPIKIGVKSDGKSGRGWRIIAGPDGTCTRSTFITFPADAAAWRTGRPTRPRGADSRATPPVNIIGGYRFPGAPAIDLRPARAAPAAPAIPTTVTAWTFPLSCDAPSPPRRCRHDKTPLKPHRRSPPPSSESVTPSSTKPPLPAPSTRCAPAARDCTCNTAQANRLGAWATARRCLPR